MGEGLELLGLWRTSCVWLRAFDHRRWQTSRCPNVERTFTQRALAILVRGTKLISFGAGVEVDVATGSNRWVPFVVTIRDTR